MGAILPIVLAVGSSTALTASSAMYSGGASSGSSYRGSIATVVVTVVWVRRRSSDATFWQ